MTQEDEWTRKDARLGLVLVLLGTLLLATGALVLGSGYRGPGVFCLALGVPTGLLCVAIGANAMWESLRASR